MAGPSHPSQRTVDVQLLSGRWRHESRKPRYGRRIFATVLVLAGLATVAVLADDAWSLRDSMRRMSVGEEIPAFRARTWANAHVVREQLADELLTSELTPSLEDRETLRNLALHTLVVAAGEKQISDAGEEMGLLLEELCVDDVWLEDLVYCCPMEHAATALPILAHIYSKEKKKMTGQPANRRFAAALAFEFARAGLEKEQALKTYLFYASSGQKHWLNNYFSNLSLWEMRVIAARFTDAAWNSEETLSWFQRNNRLPAHLYASLGESLGTHENCLFGLSVDSPEFLNLYSESAGGGVASIYEASGCSTPLGRACYTATAACANGVPALVASCDKGAVCLVAVKGRWMASAPVENDMTCSWSFCGQQHPHFVALASLLGAEMEKTRSSARLAAMGQFLYDSGNQPLAHSFFREAVKLQPLNYAAWIAFRNCGAAPEEIAAAGQFFEKLPAVAEQLRAPQPAE